MNILCILTIYNEIDFLPLKIEYCRQNKLQPYIIDNISDDGSWEWLQENNIPSHRFDTGGSFDLPALQGEMVRTIHTIKPEWVIYNGCDLFPVTQHLLHDTIEIVDKEGFNAVRLYSITFCNTGEHRNKKDPFSTYFHFQRFQYLQMICKYSPDINFNADFVDIPQCATAYPEGVLINYGQTKSTEEREQTLDRRRKAWKNGMHPGHGSHYLEGSRRGWVWDKAELTDVRETPYCQYVKQLQKLITHE